jgi:hypothetical protein
MSDQPPSYLIVVARDRADVWHGLETGLDPWAGERVELIWDRRRLERRRSKAPVAWERRHGARRCSFELLRFGFLVSERQEGRCTPCLTVLG